MKIPNRCPMCGSNSWRCINVYHSGYSVGKGFLGSLIFGNRVGGLLGLSGKKKQTYACQECRFVMDYQN